MLCQGSHALRFCQNFLSMSIEDRYSIVKKQKRCSNCLATSHDYKSCKSRFCCTVCKQKHHTLLHRTVTSPVSNQGNVSQPNTVPIITPRDSQPSVVYNSDDIPSTSATAARFHQAYSTQLQSASNHSVILGTALVDICVGNVRCTVRALIDSASEATFISKKLQSSLSLPSKASNINITGLSVPH